MADISDAGRIPVPVPDSCSPVQLQIWMKATLRHWESLGTPELRYIAEELAEDEGWELQAAQSGHALESAIWRHVVIAVVEREVRLKSTAGHVLTSIRNGTIKLKQVDGEWMAEAPPRRKRRPRLPLSLVISATKHVEATLSSYLHAEEHPAEGWQQLDPPHNKSAIGPSLRAMSVALNATIDSVRSVDRAVGGHGPAVVSHRIARVWLDAVSDVKRLRWWVASILKRMKNDVPIFAGEAGKPIDQQWHTRMELAINDLMQHIGPHVLDLPARRGSPPVVGVRLLSGRENLAIRLGELRERLEALVIAFNPRGRKPFDHLAGVMKKAAWIVEHSGGEIEARELSEAAESRQVYREKVSPKSRQYLYDLGSVCADVVFEDWAKLLAEAHRKAQLSTK